MLRCHSAANSVATSLLNDLILVLCRLLHRLVFRRKAQADAVDAVTLVSGRVETLALEHMSEMATAIGTHNLGACHAKGAVLVADDGPGDAVKVGGPPTSGAEFVAGLVQRRVAAGAAVDALLGVMLVVGARARSFGALFTEDAELFCLC